MVCPPILVLSQDRRAITPRDANSLIRCLNQSIQRTNSDGPQQDLIINCYGFFFERESAHLMVAYLRSMGVENVSTDVFVFAHDSPVRLIRLLGLSGLQGGRPSAATMQAFDEDGSNEDSEDEKEDHKEHEEGEGGDEDDDSSDKSDESEIDAGLSQEFAF